MKKDILLAYDTIKQDLRSRYHCGKLFSKIENLSINGYVGNERQIRKMPTEKSISVKEKHFTRFQYPRHTFNTVWLDKNSAFQKRKFTVAGFYKWHKGGYNLELKTCAN